MKAYSFLAFPASGSGLSMLLPSWCFQAVEILNAIPMPTNLPLPSLPPLTDSHGFSLHMASTSLSIITLCNSIGSVQLAPLTEKANAIFIMILLHELTLATPEWLFLLPSVSSQLSFFHSDFHILSCGDPFYSFLGNQILDLSTRLVNHSKVLCWSHLFFS